MVAKFLTTGVYISCRVYIPFYICTTVLRKIVVSTCSIDLVCTKSRGVDMHFFVVAMDQIIVHLGDIGRTVALLT